MMIFGSSIICFVFCYLCTMLSSLSAHFCHDSARAEYYKTRVQRHNYSLACACVI